MQEMQRVEIGGTVEFTGVPEVGAVGESCVEGFETLGLRGWGGGPGESLVLVSIGAQSVVMVGAYSLCHSQWHRLRGQQGRAFQC